MYECTDMRPSCFETFAYPLTWNYFVEPIIIKPRNALPVMLDCSQYGGSRFKKYRPCHEMSCACRKLLEIYRSMILYSV